MAKPRWATVLASVLRPMAIIVGSTFAVHRLTLRLDGAEATADGGIGGITGEADGFAASLQDALRPDDAIVESLGRTALLAGSGVAVGLVIGWLVTVALRRRQRRRGQPDRPVSAWSTGLALGLTVPGVIWLPLHRALTDRSLVPGQDRAPLGTDVTAVTVLGLWAVALGLSLAPIVVAALTGGRSWGAGGSGGDPALAGLAARPSSEAVWRVGIPTLSFGATLAVAEVAAGNGGLVDRFVGALVDGRPDDLLGLATPVIVAGALLVPAVDLGAAVLRRVERPRVPGSDRVRPDRRPTVLAVALGGLVLAAAIAGAIAGPGTEPIGGPLADARFGGPWFGTDGLGRSVATRTGAALAAALAASALPAVVATVVGAGLAFVRRTQGRWSRVSVDTLLDLASWPAAMVVPLAAWPLAAAERSPLDPVVLQVIGLLLVPLATRLQIRPTSGAERLARLAATSLVLTAAALAIQLVAGFVIPADETTWPWLGQLIASGADARVETTGPWPLTVALVAAVAAGTALHWSAGALTRVGRVARPDGGDGDTGWSSARPDRAVLAPTPGETAVDDDREGRPTAVGPTITLERDHERGGREQPSDQGDDDRGDRPDEGADDEAIDIREDVSVSSAVDVPLPVDEITIEDEATQTVELRPADLRRAARERGDLDGA